MCQIYLFFLSWTDAVIQCFCSLAFKEHHRSVCPQKLSNCSPPPSAPLVSSTHAFLSLNKQINKYQQLLGKCEGGCESRMHSAFIELERCTLGLFQFVQEVHGEFLQQAEPLCEPPRTRAFYNSSCPFLSLMHNRQQQ